MLNLFICKVITAIGHLDGRQGTVICSNCNPLSRYILAVEMTNPESG